MLRSPFKALLSGPNAWRADSTKACAAWGACGLGSELIEDMETSLSVCAPGPDLPKDGPGVSCFAAYNGPAPAASRRAKFDHALAESALASCNFRAMRASIDVIVIRRTEPSRNDSSSPAAMS